MVPGQPSIKRIGSSSAEGISRQRRAAGDAVATLKEIYHQVIKLGGVTPENGIQVQEVLMDTLRKSSTSSIYIYGYTE